MKKILLTTAFLLGVIAAIAQPVLYYEPFPNHHTADTTLFTVSWVLWYSQGTTTSVTDGAPRVSVAEGIGPTKAVNAGTGFPYDTETTKGFLYQNYTQTRGTMLTEEYPVLRSDVGGFSAYFTSNSTAFNYYFIVRPTSTGDWYLYDEPFTLTQTATGSEMPTKGQKFTANIDINSTTKWRPITQAGIIIGTGTSLPAGTQFFGFGSLCDKLGANNATIWRMDAFEVFGKASGFNWSLF